MGEGPAGKRLRAPPCACEHGVQPLVRIGRLALRDDTLLDDTLRDDTLRAVPGPGLVSEGRNTTDTL